MWGVQRVATEYPAQISLLRTIWSHPAGENSQKTAFRAIFTKNKVLLGAFWANWLPNQFHKVYLGGTHPYHTLGPLNGPLLHSRATKRARFSPQRPFWGPHRSSEGPRGPDLVPTATDWSDWAGIMVTTHFDLVYDLFWAPKVPKRARFGPKRPFWGPQRSSEGPQGPVSVPTAPVWSDWAGITVTTHYDLVYDLFWAPKVPKGARFGPKMALLGAPEVLGGPPGTRQRQRRQQQRRQQQRRQRQRRQ